MHRVAGEDGVIATSSATADLPLYRQPRSCPAGDSFYITLRCNSRQFLIAKGLRRDVLLAVLSKAKEKVPHRLYAVCLMANHLHLLSNRRQRAKCLRIHCIREYDA